MFHKIALSKKICPPCSRKGSVNTHKSTFSAGGFSCFPTYLRSLPFITAAACRPATPPADISHQPTGHCGYGAYLESFRKMGHRAGKFEQIKLDNKPIALYNMDFEDFAIEDFAIMASEWNAAPLWP